MPRVKLNEPRKDKVKELILGGKYRYGYSDEKMAALMGVSRTTYSLRMNHQHTDEWTLREVKRLCRSLNIEIAELREALRYG